MLNFSSQPKIKILVDGNCIVCDLEISHYKKLGPDSFEIVDISSPNFSAHSFGLDTAAVNRHMHILMPDGKVFKGVDAFLEIWRVLGSKYPYFRLIRGIISLPLVKQISKIFYEGFSRLRRWLPKKASS